VVDVEVAKVDTQWALTDHSEGCHNLSSKLEDDQQGATLPRVYGFIVYGLHGDAAWSGSLNGLSNHSRREASSHMAGRVNPWPLDSNRLLNTQFTSHLMSADTAHVSVARVNTPAMQSLQLSRFQNTGRPRMPLRKRVT
jgi:hypothetical protein